LIFLLEEVDFYWSSFNVFFGGRLVVFRPPKSLKTEIGWGFEKKKEKESQNGRKARQGVG
jgi:hypothetical protein